MGDMGNMKDLVKKKFEPKKELCEKRKKKKKKTYLRAKTMHQYALFWSLTWKS